MLSVALFNRTRDTHSVRKFATAFGIRHIYFMCAHSTHARCGRAFVIFLELPCILGVSRSLFYNTPIGPWSVGLSPPPSLSVGSFGGGGGTHHSGTRRGRVAARHPAAGRQGATQRTEMLSSGKKCEATAQSALGWYRPSVGVPETFGGYRSSGVLRRLTNFSSVQFSLTACAFFTTACAFDCVQLQCSDSATLTTGAFAVRLLQRPRASHGSPSMGAG